VLSFINSASKYATLFNITFQSLQTEKLSILLKERLCHHLKAWPEAGT
jgi:hypothetical protein